MDNTTFLQLMGTVFAAAIAAVGASYVARQSRTAAKETSALTGYRDLTDSLTEQYRLLSGRVEKVEDDLSDTRGQLRYAHVYIRALLDVLHTHGIAPPSPPNGWRENI